MDWKEFLLACVITYGSSVLKTIMGPVLSLAFGLPAWVGGLLTAGGMLTPMYGFYYFSAPVYRWVRKLRGKGLQKRLAAQQHRYAKLWARYGPWGVACLTPLILTPIGGSLLMFSLVEDRKKVLLPMWVCALFWGMVLSYGLHLGVHQLFF